MKKALRAQRADGRAPSWRCVAYTMRLELERREQAALDHAARQRRLVRRGRRVDRRQNAVVLDRRLRRAVCPSHILGLVRRELAPPPHRSSRRRPLRRLGRTTEPRLVWSQMPAPRMRFSKPRRSRSSHRVDLGLQQPPAEVVLSLCAVAQRARCGSSWCAGALVAMQRAAIGWLLVLRVRAGSPRLKAMARKRRVESESEDSETSATMTTTTKPPGALDDNDEDEDEPPRPRTSLAVAAVRRCSQMRAPAAPPAASSGDASSCSASADDDDDAVVRRAEDAAVARAREHAEEGGSAEQRELEVERAQAVLVGEPAAQPLRADAHASDDDAASGGDAQFERALREAARAPASGSRSRCEHACALIGAKYRPESEYSRLAGGADARGHALPRGDLRGQARRRGAGARAAESDRRHRRAPEESERRCRVSSGAAPSRYRTTTTTMSKTTYSRRRPSAPPTKPPPTKVAPPARARVQPAPPAKVAAAARSRRHRYPSRYRRRGPVRVLARVVPGTGRGAHCCAERPSQVHARVARGGGLVPTPDVPATKVRLPPMTDGRAGSACV